MNTTKWVSVAAISGIITLLAGLVDTVISVLLAVFILLTLAEAFKRKSTYYHHQKNSMGRWDVWRVEDGRTYKECVKATSEEAKEYIASKKSLTKD